MQLGDTFWAGHLHIVCSNPAPDGSVVVFNATTPRSDSDRNCILRAGEHPSIEHESVITYEQGRLLSTAQQNQLEHSQLFPRMRRERASSGLIRRIQEGALKSDQTSIEIQDIIRDQIAQG